MVMFYLGKTTETAATVPRSYANPPVTDMHDIKSWLTGAGRNLLNDVGDDETRDSLIQDLITNSTAF